MDSEVSFELTSDDEDYKFTHEFDVKVGSPHSKTLTKPSNLETEDRRILNSTNSAQNENSNSIKKRKKINKEEEDDDEFLKDLERENKLLEKELTKIYPKHHTELETKTTGDFNPYLLPSEETHTKDTLKSETTAERIPFLSKEKSPHNPHSLEADLKPLINKSVSKSIKALKQTFFSEQDENKKANSSEKQKPGGKEKNKKVTLTDKKHARESRFKNPDAAITEERQTYAYATLTPERKFDSNYLRDLKNQNNKDKDKEMEITMQRERDKESNSHRELLGEFKQYQKQRDQIFHTNQHNQSIPPKIKHQNLHTPNSPGQFPLFFKLISVVLGFALREENMHANVNLNQNTNLNASPMKPVGKIIKQGPQNSVSPQKNPPTEAKNTGTEPEQFMQNRIYYPISIFQDTANSKKIRESK